MKIIEPRFPTELLFVTGGRTPTLAWLLDCASTLNRLWCIDHGIDVCRQADLVPELLIGDLDSAQQESIDWAKLHGVEIERHPVDKDFTDTQLALLRAERLNKRVGVVMTGAFGGRIDHLYANFLTCANSPVRVCLADDREIVLFIRNGDSITLSFDRKPFTLSLLPMTEVCRGVSIDGVHWKLDRAELHQSFPNAVSNRVESREVQVSIDEGILAMHLFFDA